MTKRTLLSSLGLGFFAGALGLAGLATFIYASQIAVRSYRLERIRLWLKQRIVSLDGEPSQSPAEKRRLTILHLSDLHLVRADHDKAAFLSRITDADYDLVVITGDIFENESGFVHAPSLLVRKPRLGAYAVLGNHDYYAYTLFNKTVGELIKRYRTPSQKRNIGPFMEALEEQGYQVLRNQLVQLKSENLAIIGIDYPTIGKAELGRLARQTSPEQLLIALFHLPKNLQMLCQSGIQLALGGHTHGGQVRLPGLGALVTHSELPRKHASGLIWQGDTAFHISRGLGTDPRTKVRLFCPPAATIIEVMEEV